ncbi:MAG: hypothetical protein HY072_00390, partial [Deltaproteobacteria bacterium]|nr:hypothetical protein [Deltaproteobacteria bacterium]
RAKSDLLLEVRLKNPVHYFIYLPSFWVTFPIRLDVIKKYGKNWFLPKHVVTLGPYLLDGWEKNKFILLKKNSLYYRSEVFNANTPEKVTFMIEPDDQKARDLFEGSKVDVFLDATTQDLINKNPKTKILQFPYLATYYLGFQVGVGPLKDLDVRKAIACSIDTHQIPSIMQGGQIEATGWIPPELLAELLAELSAELRRNRMPLNCTLFDAKASLSKAGYPEGKGFPTLNLFIEKFDGASLLAQEIQKSLKEKLGIKIQTQITTQTKFLKATRSNQAGLFITHWGADFPDPANFFELFLSDNNANLTFWKKQEYDQKVKAARQTLPQKERFVLFDEAEKILIQKEFVILPLFYRKNTVLVHDNIKSFSVTPLNYLFFKNVVLN